MICSHYFDHYPTDKRSYVIMVNRCKESLRVSINSPKVTCRHCSAYRKGEIQWGDKNDN